VGRPLAFFLAFLLSACGVPSGETGRGPNETIVTAGNLQVTARPAHLPAGRTINITIRLTGPADYDAGCVQTLRIWAVNSNGAQVWQQPQQELQCFALTYRHLAAGQAASFSDSWPVSAGTPAGRYTIHGLFLFHLPIGAGMRVRENLPPVSVEITD
jgi:hypothetical protein